MKALGDTIYQEWESFVANCGRPDAIKDKMILGFQEARQDQINTWARRLPVERIKVLPKDVQDEVRDARNRLGISALHPDPC